MHQNGFRTCIMSAACVVATFASADAPITWTPVRRVGDTFHWIQKTSIVSNMLPVGLESIVDETITEVAPDGSYTVAVTQGKTNVSWAFEELPTPDDSIKSTYRCNARGEIMGVEADPNYTEWAARSHNLETVISPDKPVKPGDVWTHDFESNSTTGSVAAHGVYKLLGITGGKATIEIKVNETEGLSPAACSGEVVVNLSTFMPTSLSFKLKDAALPGLPGLGTGTVTQNLMRTPTASDLAGS